MLLSYTTSPKLLLPIPSLYQAPLQGEYFTNIRGKEEKITKSNLIEDFTVTPLNYHCVSIETNLSINKKAESDCPALVVIQSFVMKARGLPSHNYSPLLL